MTTLIFIGIIFIAVITGLLWEYVWMRSDALREKQKSCAHDWEAEYNEWAKDEITFCKRCGKQKESTDG